MFEGDVDDDLSGVVRVEFDVFNASDDDIVKSHLTAGFQAAGTALQNHDVIVANFKQARTD